MTTKLKIILGFACMVVLLAVVSVIGYTATERSADGFVEYQRLAQFNIATSDFEKELYNASDNIGYFLIYKDSAYLKRATEALERAQKQVDTAMSLSREESRKATVRQLGETITGMGALRDRVEKGVMAASRQYTEGVQGQARIFIGLLDELTASIKESSQSYELVRPSIDILLSLNSLWEDLAAARSSGSRYAESRQEVDAKSTKEDLAAMRGKITEIQRTMVTERTRGMVSKILDSYNSYVAAFDELVGLNEQVNATMAELAVHMEAGFKISGELSAERDSAMRASGRDMRAQSDLFQRIMMGVGVAGLLIGAAIALLIVMGLVRTLNLLAGFASEVAKGNFDIKGQITEKGEVGITAAALRSIPQVLRQVMDEARQLTLEVTRGKYRSRIDSSKFEMGFSELTTMFNNVGASYTAVLDVVPVPIMSCNKDLKIQFLNKPAQGAVGGDFIGEDCEKHLCADSCGNSNACFGKVCMSRNSAYTNETIVRPQGHHMDVAVTATPLHDEDGNVVGYLELLTDLTEIKDKQNTILRVANQASDIADRVAAASEEIAAQVEQISRGAEMQREQMQSTASAMTEMNSTVLEVARNASQASEQGELTRDNAVSGAELVNQVVQAIQDVYEISSKMQNNMEELGKQADSIGGVISVITDVADQTNLLALNAAIEAARAGEAGRGFAVVADSVRQLAEATMKATQEVGASIANIQSATRVNIGDMTIAGERVQRATELANSSGQALEQIVSLVGETSSLVASIATAAEEQSSTSDEITRSIDQVNIIVGETAEGMLQSSAAVQDLSSQAQQLKATMEELK